MTKKYTVIHSKDPWLLARMSTDLMLDEALGAKFDWHPFEDEMEWLCLNDDDGHEFICFHNHMCFGNPIRYELTSRNYTSVLTKIIEG